jgi:hypothetical protein
MIYATTFTKQPLTVALYHELKAHLTAVNMAAIITHRRSSLPSMNLNCKFMPLDLDLRCMPVKPETKDAERWLVNAVKSTKLSETEFKVWYPDEEATDFPMEIYLNHNYDGLEMEQVEELLEALNPRFPPQESRIIHQVQPQLDRFDNPRGRVLHIKADATFYEYCKARNFKLNFSGDDLTCITQADKTRLNMLRNSRRPYADREDQSPGRGRGYGYGYGGRGGRGEDRGGRRGMGYGASYGYGGGPAAEKRPRN